MSSRDTWVIFGALLVMTGVGIVLCVFVNWALEHAPRLLILVWALVTIAVLAMMLFGDWRWL